MIEGTLQIAFRDGIVTLESGELFVIPISVEHKSMAAAECKIIIIEPKGVINTGDTNGQLTAENDVWI